MASNNSRTQVEIRDDAIEVAVSAMGAVVGFASASLPGAIAGAAAGPAIRLALKADQNARERRLQRAGKAVEVAAEASGMSPEQVSRWADGSFDRAELLARVIQSAANGRTAEKIAALGLLLGQSVQDDAALDEAFVLAAALDEIEAPHLRLLALINSAAPAYAPRGEPQVGCEWVDPGREKTTNLPTLADDVGGALTLPSVAAVLQRHGLVEYVNDFGGALAAELRAADRGGMHPLSGSQPTEFWRSTALGHRCLLLLLPVAPCWAEPGEVLRRRLDRMLKRDDPAQAVDPPFEDDLEIHDDPLDHQSGENQAERP